MDVSPKTLREVEFREKLRGYHPEDVDQFLEQVAIGLEGMQDRLRQAVERAQRAESAAAAAPPPSADTAASAETLRKTLVLAQRTADLAVQEAREQAARILSSAESQAQARLGEADERARRTHEDALSDIRAELSALEVTRQRAQQDVDALNRWVEEHRSQLSASLSEALSLVERVGVRSPAPTSRPIDRPSGPRLSGPVIPSPLGSGPPPTSSRGGPPGPPTPSPAERDPAPAAGGALATPVTGGPNTASFKRSPPDPGVDSGPPTTIWTPGEAVGAGDRPEDRVGDNPTPGRGTPALDDDRHHEVGSEEQALDDFFEDDDDSGYLGERRFGGRLRRRR